MKAIVVLLFVAAAAAGATHLIQLSDETAESGTNCEVGSATLCQYEMPASCDSIVKIRVFRASASNSTDIKLVAYNQSHTLVGWKMVNVGSERQWYEFAFASSFAGNQTFYIGVEWVNNVFGIGVDTDFPYHAGKMWFRNSTGVWTQATPAWDFMIGVYVDGPGDAVTPLSLGRVKATYR